MDTATLSEAMGGRLPRARYAALCPAFNAAMLAAGVTSPRRAAMWCAQLGHEGGGLAFMGESWGPTEQQEKYGKIGGSVARNLGNIRPSDGYDFRGAGPIMVTGRHNFGEVSRWGHEHGLCPTSTYFLDHPDELRSDRYGFVGAVWYWTVARPDINALSDRGDIETVTRRINGGLTNLADRKARYQRCLALGARLLPSGPGPAAPASTTAPPRRRRAVPEEATEPMILPPTFTPPGWDPNSDPRTWPQVVRTIPFDVAGGWMGECAIALGAEEVGGRGVDHLAGYLQLASWVLDPAPGGGDVVYRPVLPALAVGGSGAPLQRHWQTPPFTAPVGARAMVINYSAPGGAYAAIGRHLS